MPLFYPDNQKRADRLMQLIDQVGLSQKTSSDSFVTIKNAEDGILTSIQPIMQKQNIVSTEDFIQYIKSLMPGDAQEEYQKVIDATEGLKSTNSDAVLLASGLLFAIAVKGGSSLNANLFFKAVAAMRSLRSYAYGINIIVTQGREAGLVLLKDLRIPLKGVLSHLNVANTFGDVISITSTVAKVITWLGYHAEWLAIIGQIIIESNQRDELIKNIHEGLVDRCSLYYFESQLRQSTEFAVALKSFVGYVEKYGMDNEIVVSTAQDLAQNIQDSLGKVTLDGVLERLSNLDSDAYTNDDLTASEVKAKVEEEIRQFEAEATT